MSLEEMRTEIEAKSIYRVQWDVVEACAQLYGDFDRLRWFTTPHFPEGNGILGQWNGRHEITFLEGAEFNVQVIRHEILHELLDGDGEHLNPRWEWCEIPTGVDG